MALLLSIETSASTCSVAIHEDGRLLSLINNAVPQSASAKLAVMVQQACDDVKKKPNQLRGVIVAAGPGSYTGLRIGVATAKGICYALQIPLISVNTLELMAYQFNSNLNSEITKEGEVYSLCPMLDARRMEVYCMRLNSKLRIVEPTQAKIIDESSFIAWLEEHPVYFFGDGAEKCKAVIKHANAHFKDGIIPSAAQLGELGFAKWKALQFEDTATFEPFYLKDFMIKNHN